MPIWFIWLTIFIVFFCLIYSYLALLYIIKCYNEYDEPTQSPSGQVPVEEKCIIFKKFLKKKDKGVFYG